MAYRKLYQLLFTSILMDIPERDSIIEKRSFLRKENIEMILSIISLPLCIIAILIGGITYDGFSVESSYTAKTMMFTLILMIYYSVFLFIRSEIIKNIIFSSSISIGSVFAIIILLGSASHSEKLGLFKIIGMVSDFIGLSIFRIIIILMTFIPIVAILDKITSETSYSKFRIGILIINLIIIISMLSFQIVGLSI